MIVTLYSQYLKIKFTKEEVKKIDIYSILIEELISQYVCYPIAINNYIHIYEIIFNEPNYKYLGSKTKIVKKNLSMKEIRELFKKNKKKRKNE